MPLTPRFPASSSEAPQWLAQALAGKTHSVSVDPILVGKAEDFVYMLPDLSNRHGLVTGATGTGKTVTLQTLAEQFSARGVPVFMADVKGDLSGVCAPGGGNPKIEDRAKQIGVNLEYQESPVIFWDLFGQQGHPIRATVSEMGPLLISRVLQLNDVQEGVINIAFKVADDEGLLLLDLKDLRAMLTSVAEHADAIQKEYGMVATTSIGAIQRQLLVLEQQGADQFFGEPALELNDLMRTTTDGRGYLSILAADKLIQNPRLYATFLLWLMSELFEQLPEVGDPEKPKLVFFFDEAHLLFDDAPPSLIQRIEQVVRLIRSKGVGVYFVTQNPLDVPDTVLAQLGNRVQHALRAYTPRDQKAVKTAADTFRPNPAFSTEEVITQLGVGEALVSMLEPKGVPAMVQRTFIRPPMSHIGPPDAISRQAAANSSPVGQRYTQTVDRESAYERLQAIAQQQAQQQAEQQAQEQEQKAPTRQRESIFSKVATSTLRSMGSQIGRSLMRGLLGNLFKR